MGTTGTSRCQFFAFAIAVVLIVLDLSTTVLVKDTRANIKSIRDQIYKLENYPTIQSVSDENSGFDESASYQLADNEISVLSTSETRILRSSHKRTKRVNPSQVKHLTITAAQKRILKSRLSIEEKNFFSDGGNDNPPSKEKQICVNAEADGGFKHENNIFYTLFTPTSKTQNPDIESIHLADHQRFKMTPNFEGRLSPNLTNFNLEKRKTLIYVHGFLSSSYAKSSLLKQLFTATNDYNLILMDWRVLAKHSKMSKRKRRDLSWSEKLENKAFDWAVKYAGYDTAFKNRHLVARELYYLLEIILHQLSASDIHIVGHSLGAHIAGEASHYLTKNIGVKIGRITGLDPASLCFTETDDVAMQKQLSKDKADFVDVWHTNSNLAKNNAGLARPVGHVDYWVNGGKYQPICKLDADFNEEMGLGGMENYANGGVSPCSHSLAEQYFVDSLMRCKGSGFGNYETGFRSSRIGREEIYKYQHNGLGEVEMNFTTDFVEVGPDMGFWTGEDDFAEFISGSGSWLDFLTVNQTMSGSDGSGDDEITSEESEDLLIIKKEESNRSDFGKYHKFWSESQNFIVFTKTVRNPNKIGELENKFWGGYCDDR